jgi:hypothetical protein
MKSFQAIAMLLGRVGVCMPTCPANAAGNFNGSVPLLCVPTAVTECVADGECRPGTAESEKLPEFFKIDLKAGTVRTEDKSRQSPRTLDSRQDDSARASAAAGEWLVDPREHATQHLAFDSR